MSRDGPDATVEYYTNAESVDGEWYVVIVNSEGYTIAHHNPKFRNRDPSLRVDSKGRFYGDELLGATADGRWVDYFPGEPRDGRRGPEAHVGRQARRYGLRLRLVRTVGRPDDTAYASTRRG